MTWTVRYIDDPLVRLPQETEAIPTNYVLQSDGTWVAPSGGGGVTQLGGLDDVTLSPTVDDGSLLIYDSDAGEWVDGYAAVKAPVHNNTLSPIDKGTPVYISGTHTSGKPTVEPADNNGAGTHPAIGLAFEDIAAGTEGRVIVSGMLHGVDTTAYSAGDALYLDSTPGVLTSTRPSLSADQVQKVGIVTRVNVSAGDILVIGAGRVNDVNNELITLTGVARLADDLGTFTGGTISDANTIKGALQELETAVETVSGGGVSDGDKGDIVVSGSGTVWTIDTDVIDFTNFADTTASGTIYDLSLGGGAALVLGTIPNTLTTGTTTDNEYYEVPMADLAAALVVQGTLASQTGNNTLSGTNTFTGTTTFNTSLPTSTVTPSNATDLTTKTYVDTEIAAIGGISDGDKGDITVSGSGSVWTIDSGVVSNSKMASMADDTIKGNVSGVSAAPSDLTATQVRTMINVEDGATADQTNAEIETAYNAQVAQVSGAEITAGTATGIRRYSPADIVNFVSTHETAPPVDSVNTQTGAVVLDADDISDTSTTNKFVTAADVTKLGHISVTQAVNLDTMESDIATNNAKVGVTDGDKGDIVVSSSGTLWNIEAGSVTNSKLEDVGNNTIKGNVSGGIAAPSDLSAAQVRTMINVEDGATADQTNAEIEAAYNAQVDQVTGAEITAGTDTTVHRFSPADIASFVDQHEEVKLAANNTFTGANSFSSLPTSGTVGSPTTPTLANELITKSFSDSQDLVVYGACAKLALANTMSGANTFTGTTTFNSSLPTSTVTPSGDTDLTTKVYVDDQIDTTVLAGESFRGTGGSPYVSQTTSSYASVLSFTIPANTLTTRNAHIRIQGTITTPTAAATNFLAFYLNGTLYHASSGSVATSQERPFSIEIDLSSMGSSTIHMIGSTRLAGTGGTAPAIGNHLFMSQDGCFGNYNIAESDTSAITFDIQQRFADITNTPVFKIFGASVAYI